MTGWVAVLDAAKLPERDIHAVEAGGRPLLVVRAGERLAACERACPHEQADLAEGQIDAGRLRCPRHFASFDLDTGALSGGFPSRPLRLYPVRVEGGTVWVNLAAGSGG